MNDLLLFVLTCLLFCTACTDGSDSHNSNSSKRHNKHHSQNNNSSSDSDFDCPLIGTAKTEQLQELNTSKNRSDFPLPNDFVAGITLGRLLEKGDDRERWANGTAVKITGYVKDVKVGGVETTNCKSTDKAFRDTHIELVLDPMSTENNTALIVEITPRIRKIIASKLNEDWSTSAIRDKYLGRWVQVEGWLLFDSEHANMAENTHPGNPKNWRGTAWEIHPVTRIRIAEKH